MADVKQYQEMCKQLRELSNEIDQQKIILKQLNEKYEEIEKVLMATMEEDEMHSFKSDYGTVYISTFDTVSMPQDEERKAAFFQYLKDKDLYDSMISVNSQKLNGFYRREIEAAREAGDILFTVPGLEAKSSPRLGFRKG